ncbi:MAG: phage tail sheath subtilisin-like domain-containing protein [Enhygromyxa sp.]
MPEYLSPGVYVEEVSFRSKSIEGVPTSTTGFVGMTRTGPVYYAHGVDTDGRGRGPTQCEPRLVTSWTEFERVFGGLDPLQLDGGVEWIPYLAHAARAFFENGGQRLYVARVFVPVDDDEQYDGVASFDFSISAALQASWRARWPGAAGNVVVQTSPRRSGNLIYSYTNPATEAPELRLRQVRTGSVVELSTGSAPKLGDPVTEAQLRVVSIDPDGVQSLIDSNGASTLVTTLPATQIVQLIEVDVSIVGENDRFESYTALSGSDRLTRAVRRILQKDDPENEDASVWLDLTPSGDAYWPAQLTYALLTAGSGRLTGGNDGVLATPDDLEGDAADVDDATVKATGLEALAEITDIAIVAAPDSGAFELTTSEVAAQKLIAHAERLRYRIAVVDGPRGSSLTQIRDFRGKLDSKYAALYHPWVEILDPTQRPSQGAPPERLLLPPSGYVTGIYARNDIERGVFKAPANEIVRGITRFEANITKPRQDVLNPEGINALRFFEGRGNRVWGARTLSSDPEWKYVNVRRLFIFIEHSIDKGTQWAVFEPNGPQLWANVRRTIEDFLTVLWRDGALLGDKREHAFFVRCDRTTMTQNDLDNGRMICLIGVAPVKPAEFVIFRIGQWTADAS